MAQPGRVFGPWHELPCWLQWSRGLILTLPATPLPKVDTAWCSFEILHAVCMFPPSSMLHLHCFLGAFKRPLNQISWAICQYSTSENRNGTPKNFCLKTMVPSGFYLEAIHWMIMCACTISPSISPLYQIKSPIISPLYHQQTSMSPLSTGIWTDHPDVGQRPLWCAMRRWGETVPGLRVGIEVKLEDWTPQLLWVIYINLLGRSGENDGTWWNMMEHDGE